MAMALEQMWLTWAQAALYTTLSERTLRNLAAAGRLNVRRPVPGRAVLSRLELDELLASRPSTWRAATAAAPEPDPADAAIQARAEMRQQALAEALAEAEGLEPVLSASHADGAAGTDDR